MTALRSVPSGDLQRLRDDVWAGRLKAPLTRAGLLAVQLGHLWGALSGLPPMDAAGLQALLDAVLAERGGGRRVELVWTGPEGTSSWSRPTAAVVRELFGQARRSVLVAGYSFDHGAEILRPLHEAMRDRGVAVEMFVHVRPAPRRQADLAAHARQELLTFLAVNWSFGPPHPALHYDPRTLRPRSVESLHAKCIVVDERVSLIGSANFTDRGQSRNIEVGGLIEDESFARALASQWHAATAAGVFVRWQG